MNDIPSKCRNLQVLHEKGVPVPHTFFLSEEELHLGSYKEKIVLFLSHNKENDFIVRSCILGEDGGAASYAGHFKSSERTARSNIMSVIDDLFHRNKVIQEELLPGGKTNLMIQPYIDQEVGGVLFSPWQYFSQHCLIEWSKDGPQAVVSGKRDGWAVVSFDETSLNCEWEEPLKQAVKDVQIHFSYPLDIEWGYGKDKKIYILQVRPMTMPLGALQIANTEEVVMQYEAFQSLERGEWRIDSFAESLGVLSPFSFSVFEALYDKSSLFFQTCGFRAEKLFFTRAMNGQVYTHNELYQQYFSFASWWKTFLFSAKKTYWQRTIQQYIRAQEASDTFSFEWLLQVFQYWVLANVYTSDVVSRYSFYGQVGEYELSWDQKAKFPETRDVESWDGIRTVCKQLFLYEYRKLNVEKMGKRYCEKYQQSLNDEQYTAESKRLLKQSFVSYPHVIGGEDGKESSLVWVSGRSIEGTVQVILDPATFRGDLLEGQVLVAPYFDNKWITQIDRLAGVVLEEGGVLSHSAIVAREKQIPYVIGMKEACERYADGKIVL